MEQIANGVHVGPPQIAEAPDHMSNGHHEMAAISEPTQEELENELPLVLDGQVPLSELLSRVVQTIYAELTEMAETLPNMSDTARKRTIADWVVKMKKQAVKLYAVARWSRDAHDVQKAMNITAFLMDQNRQFEDAIHGLTYMKESLAPARLRNHDILTSLDVLTTGSYLRLPTNIKKIFIPPTPLTDAEVEQTLRGMEDVMRYRLRMQDIVPVEMSQYKIEKGRTFFNVPDKFKTSISLKGPNKEDGWFFVHVEFLHDAKGSTSAIQEFPREPVGLMKRHITDEADSRLGFYLPIPEEQMQQPGFEPPPRPQLPPGTVDAPLVRLFNFLQMMSLSYQLEILFFQARRMRSLGWAEFLSLQRSRDSKSFIASYWIRPNTNVPGRPPPPPNRNKIPPIGGTLTVSIVETHAPPKAGGGPLRKATDRVLAELQLKNKFGELKPSDEVESFKLSVKWEPSVGALGVIVPPEFVTFVEGELEIDSQALDFEALLQKVLLKHVHGILRVFQHSLRTGMYRAVFSPPGEVVLLTENDISSLRVHLCADEFIIVSIDSRTGRLTLRDTGDLAASGKGARCAIVSEKVNENPLMIYEALIRLRYNTITELAEQKASYLGLQSFRKRNFPKEEMAKWGPTVRAQLFIQLANFRLHYLVLVATDDEFRYALISVTAVEDSPQGYMKIDDIAWLDVDRIHNGDILVKERKGEMVGAATPAGALIKEADGNESDNARGESFKLETSVLRELYSYCCARVSYTRVELQLKLRQIPFTRVNPIINPNLPELAHIQSSLARSVPGLCVQASDILAGAPAAEAAMPNIRVIPLNWWAGKKTQVVMCVKLKYVQQPIGKRAAGAGRHGSVIRPSKRIIYDTREAIVSFLSESVDNCVDEFLEEWAKVSKMVVIAREVAQMAKSKTWTDVKLLSFDLQTVEFLYAKDYAISITCTDQQLISTSGTYEISFSRVQSDSSTSATSATATIASSSSAVTFTDPFNPSTTDSGSKPAVEATDIDGTPINPHADAEPFLRNVLCHGRLATSLHELVSLLRDTLAIAVELYDAKMRFARAVTTMNENLAEGVGPMDVDGGAGGDDEVKKWEEYQRKVRVLAFPKSATWYRVMYGDFRHALDFRLLSGRRVLMIDASHFVNRSGLESSFTTTSSTTATTATTTALTPAQNPSPPKSLTPTPQITQTPTPQPTPEKPASSKTTATSQPSANTGPSEKPSNSTPIVVGFQPIPDMHNIVRSAIYDALHTPGTKVNIGRIADIEVGIMCTVDAVPLLVRPLHDRVVMRLGMEMDEKLK